MSPNKQFWKVGEKIILHIFFGHLSFHFFQHQQGINSGDKPTTHVEHTTQIGNNSLRPQMKTKAESQFLIRSF